MKVKMDYEGYERRVKKVVCSLADLNLAHSKSDIHAFIDKFADNGLRSLAIAYYQEVLKRPKETPGGLWQFVWANVSVIRHVMIVLTQFKGGLNLG
ncbi:putative P-type H(+)-exporting transporter [Helianthus annuus]|nr:putative P-type H(+)-exporting transporter [Helianthus annuus]